MTEKTELWINWWSTVHFITTMPSVWSKILKPEWSLPYNCYEIGKFIHDHCLIQQVNHFEISQVIPGRPIAKRQLLMYVFFEVISLSVFLIVFEWQMTTVVFREALKLYTPLYVFQTLMRRKFDEKALKSLVINISRSSAFLAFSALLMMTFFCNLRKYSGIYPS